MDKLIVEKEVEVQTKIENENAKNIDLKSEELSQDIVFEKPSHQTEYLNSLENLTVADIKRQQEKKEAEEFKKEKEVLIEKQFEKVEQKQEVCQNIIEKPNYDFIEEKKVVKLKTNKIEKKKRNKKIAGIVLSCALGASAIICVTNAVIIDNMSANFTQIDETYKLNLYKYLKNIANLDSTKKSMEVIETYPEEILDAGNNGLATNWFDRICNFINGFFGG